MGTANDQALHYAYLCIGVIFTVVSNAGENIYTIHELSHVFLEGGVISGCRYIVFFYYTKSMLHRQNGDRYTL
jgi:hypothetical protein